MSNEEKWKALYRNTFLTSQKETRTLLLRLRGHKEMKVTLDLRVLIAGSMYLVLRDGNHLKKGQILIRNLDLQRRLNGAPATSYGTQLFVRYDNLFDAYRAMSRLNPRYLKTEIPALQHWQNECDKLMQMAWELSAKNVGEKHVQYKVHAYSAAGPHEHVQNPHKELAYKQALRAAEVKDRKGRINSGRLPLMLLTVDVELWKRIVQIRGIGHRTDFRALVLDLYIQKMMESVELTRLDLKHLLRPEGVLGTSRTPRNVHAAIKHLQASGAHLKTLVARPFSHVFDHVQEDFEEAEVLMLTGAENRDPIIMNQAKMYLHRAYRSLVLVQKSWLLQEALTTVALVHHRHEELSYTQVKELEQVLTELAVGVVGREPLTCEPYEHEFRNPILSKVIMNLEAILTDLLPPYLRQSQKQEPHSGLTREVYKKLKLAVAPF